MHPRAAEKFRRHLAPLLEPGETLLAGARAVTGGYIGRQNASVIVALVLFALSVYAAVRGGAFAGWLHGLAIVLFILPAILIAQSLHGRARRFAALGAHGAAAEVLRRSALLLAATDRRLLVFARPAWSARFGPPLAAFPLRAVRERKPRALPMRLPLVDIELAEGAVLDLELLTIDRPAEFLAALEKARAAARRGGGRP